MRKRYAIVADIREQGGEYSTLRGLERDARLRKYPLAALRHSGDPPCVAPAGPADLLLPVPLRGRPRRHDDGAALGALGTDRDLRALRDDDYPDSQGKLSPTPTLPRKRGREMARGNIEQ